MLDCIEIDAPIPASASVIWLHGLGADGNDFVPIVPQLGLPEDHGVRFIFPNAPMQPVTVNGGMAMRAWYDIRAIDLVAREDSDGINASRCAIEALIEQEMDRGVPAHRIVLAGFSQGGAIALHTGLRYRERLAGIMALSTYLPLRDRFEEQASAANGDIPIFMAHGKADPVVPISLARTGHERLNAAGHTIAWHEYPMQHQVCLEEIQAIGDWLRNLL